MKQLFGVVLLFFLPVWIVADTIETFYGPLEVEEPILLELINSPAFLRLKGIHQYGVSYYTTHREPYTRHAHSLGVFLILRKNGASLEEQIAGLLHDVSHTVFSHVGDWVFGKEHQEFDYQNSIHENFLEKSGLAEILHRYQLSTEQMLPLETLYPMLEQKGPNLCADRIDYNIQGAYYQGFITHEEAKAIFDGLTFKGGIWVSHTPSLMEKLVRFSLFMTLNCWGSAQNHFISRTLADAILRGLEIGVISSDEIHFGTDDAIWNRLFTSDDSLIQTKMGALLQPEDHYSLVEYSDADQIIKSKFRGIDPWISTEKGVVRLTSINRLLQEEYLSTKEQIEKGWPLKFLHPLHL